MGDNSDPFLDGMQEQGNGRGLGQNVQDGECSYFTIINEST